MVGRVTHCAARSCAGHGAASGVVDNPSPHLTTTIVCPNKRGHLCRMHEIIVEKL